MSNRIRRILPAVALGPLLGALADRLPRRTSLVAADVLRLGAFLIILVAIIGFMYRYLAVMADEASRMMRARAELRGALA